VRDNRRAGAGDLLFCSIVHTVTISNAWELTRAIFCLAVDRDALRNIRKYAALKIDRLEGVENTAPVVHAESTKIICAAPQESK
jgi:hypothetical protein